MFNRTLFIVLLVLAATFSVRAGDIQGTIVIQRKLTKRKVTPSPSLYERGMAVELATDQDKDPLAFERTHVVIYLEGDSPSTEITAEMNQQNRRFSPDLVVIPAGAGPAPSLPDRPLRGRGMASFPLPTGGCSPRV